MFKALPIAFDSPYFTILTKNKSHLAYFDRARYPYMSLRNMIELHSAIKVHGTAFIGTQLISLSS